jgi:hypothetical protein
MFSECKPGTFIYTLDDALTREQCEEMIDQFEASPGQHVIGRIGPQARTEESIKRSTDLRVSGRPEWERHDTMLRNSLGRALGLLSGLHPFFKVNRMHDIGYNIQRTSPGGYYHWHLDSGPGEFAQRQLVALWYLNDAPAMGGETEFYFQQVSVRARCGMLLLFPPFWTHLHRGAEVVDGVKYIATTWVCVD